MIFEAKVKTSENKQLNIIININSIINAITSIEEYGELINIFDLSKTYKSVTFDNDGYFVIKNSPKIYIITITENSNNKIQKYLVQSESSMLEFIKRYDDNNHFTISAIELYHKEIDYFIY